MAGTFNVMDLEQFIREYMKEYIKQSQPDMDISENSAFDDIFIKPMISIMKPIFPLLTNTELKSNLKFAPYLTDEEIEDIGVNNYAVYRDTGATATALQTFGFSRVPERGITIPQGVIVSTSSGLMYTTTYSTTYSKTEMQKSFNAATQTYDVTCFVTANGLGSMYNVGENMINICQTSFSEYLVYTTNKVAVVNGSDSESTESYIAKCLTYYANQHLGTRPGYERSLMQIAKQLTDIKVIGYKDKGMERDIFEIVEKDVDNKTVFSPPIDGYRYAVTRTKHIGGCVDIYVRGSEYAVETVKVPINSNVICFSGPIDKSSLKVLEGTNANTVPVDFSVGYFSDPSRAIPNYEGEAIENLTITGDVSDDVKQEITKAAEAISAQITFSSIFKGETVPKSPLAFIPGTYTYADKPKTVESIVFEENSSGPVTCKSDSIVISEAWGDATEKPFTINLTITCKYNNTQYSFKKKFLAAAIKDETVAYVSSYDKWADTIIVFVNKYYNKPTDITVSYVIADSDAPQSMSQVYKVGYDKKVTEIKAPLSESLIRIYYNGGDSDWTYKDFNDWSKKFKDCIGTDISSSVCEDGDDDDERDLISYAKMLRYRLSMNRIIEGDEIDDDGFNASHDIHKFDSYYKDSSQEKIFVTLSNDSDESTFKNLFQLLPNTSAATDSAGLEVQYSYNDTLHKVQTSMFEDDDRIITADVLVKEAARVPINVAMRINVKNNAELTSAMRAQMQAAISQLFSDAGINGRIEQSDIVGKLYSDSTTSTFVEYVRLALDAFYIPSDVNAEVENINLGDYIQADEKSYLYLNKMVIDTLKDTSLNKRLTRIYKIANFEDLSPGQEMTGLISIGEPFSGRTFAAEAIDENGNIVLGTASIITIDGERSHGDNTAAEGTYNVCFEFRANDGSYDPIYTNQIVVVK